MDRKVKRKGEEKDLFEEAQVRALAQEEYNSLATPRLGEIPGLDKYERRDQELISSILPFWVESKRNKLAMDLSGFLRKERYTKEHTKAIIKEICEITKDEELRSRLRTVEETYKKPITEIRGYVGLKEIIPYESLKGWSEKGKRKEEDKRIFTSLVISEKENIIAEQVYQEGKNLYCVYNTKTKKTSYVDNIGDNYPIVAQEINKGFVLLPSRAEEYNTEEELDQKIKEFINKWLDIPEDTQQFALWSIKRSWVYERFHTINYLRALGDTGLGKTRYLDTLGSIHYKPINTSGATTSAPVFRIIDKWKGTLIIDEADFKSSSETEDIIKIINQGFEKGKPVMRCDQNDASKIDFFNPFCPKLLATRRSFTDKATESRCITQVMLGTKRQDIPYNLNEDFFKEAEKIRNKLLMWRFKNYYKIDQSKDVYKGFEKIEPRLKQTFNSFVSLFKNNEKQLEEFDEFVKGKQEEIIEERRNSFQGEIIEGIHNLLEKGQVHINNSDIIKEMSLTDFKNQPLKPRGLNSTLKSLGFKKAINKRLGEEKKRCIPLEKEHLKQLFERYGFGTVSTVGTVVMESSDLRKYSGKGNPGTVGGLSNSTVPTVPIVPDEFSRLPDNILMPCSICAGVKEPCVWEDNRGKLYCDNCKLSIEKNK